MLPVLLIWFARLAIAFELIAALLPFVSSGAWWIRLFDFPRMQFAMLLTFPAAAVGLHWWLRGFRTEHAWLLGVVGIIGMWQLSHVLPYTNLWQKELADAGVSEQPDLHVMVANLKIENERYDEVIKELRKQDADLVLLIEVDKRWDAALEPISSDYPFAERVIRDEGLGMMLLSKLAMRDVEVKHLVEKRRASIFATLELTDGDTVRFVGVHPTPPGLDDDTGSDNRGGERRDSRVRDAELVLVAREVAEHTEQKWIVTGDFNDVAWSHTTRLFKRLSGLRDPRVGRKLLDTYNAEHTLIRFPIDHVFMSDGFTVHGLQRIRMPGSDHFAISVRVNVPSQAKTTPEADAEDKQEAEQLVKNGKQDAAERDVKAE